jgi:hypothetical protein
MDVEMLLRWQARGVRIQYLPEVLVSMKYGGVSNQCAEAGFSESRRAFLRYNYPPLMVNLLLAGKLLVNRILSLGSR